MLKSLIKRVTIEKANLKAQRIVVVDDDEVNERILKKLKIDINFELTSNDIIHHVNTKAHRLCISKIVEKKIFRLIHDENHYFEIHRYYEKIFNTFYISRLFRKLRRYIKHCFNYQLT